tara:strand:+ start:105 stop:839 length:735 start_codon:yes stop_codon:yes gene_type:complete
MGKNIVFITSMPGEVDTSYQQYSFNTWKWWCKRNNVELFHLSEPLTDVKYMKPTWQRWYSLEILESNNIEYDQVAMVDVDTMVRWDTPNFFELTDRKFAACVDNDNISWVKQSIDGYKHLFKDVVVDWESYFNCGFIVLNEKHKNLCKNIVKFWDDNNSELSHLQNTLRKGTDQTPVNYMAKRDVEIKYLSKKFNLTHFNRKEILQDLMFIDCGYVWHFNGFEKSWRTPIMKDTWEKIKDNYAD